MLTLIELENNQLTSSKFKQVRNVLLTIIAALALVACGGSSGSKKSNSDPTNNTSSTKIKEINGLDTLAGPGGLLFYTYQPDKDKAYQLKAVDPSDAASLDSPALVDNELKNVDLGFFNAFPIPEATVKGQLFDSFKIDQVLYWKHKEPGEDYKLKRVETNALVSSITPHIISTIVDSSDIPYVAIDLTLPPLLQYDLSNSNNSRYGFSPANDLDVSDGLLLSQTPIGATSSSAKTNFKGVPLAPLWDAIQNKPAGWLLVDIKDSANPGIVKQIGLDGTVVGTFLNESNAPIKFDNNNGFIANTSNPYTTLGPPFADGSQLVINYLGDGGTGTAEVWIFHPNSSDFTAKGTLVPYTNANGEQLKFIGMNLLLAARNMAFTKDATYFFGVPHGSSSNKNKLYRTDENHWQVLYEVEGGNLSKAVSIAGDRLIWKATKDGKEAILSMSIQDPEDIITLDKRVDGEVAPKERRTTGFLPKISGSDRYVLTTNKKVFYNRSSEIGYLDSSSPWAQTKIVKEAVITNADGSGQTIVIPHAVWIGASTNGEGLVRTVTSLMSVGGQYSGLTKGLGISEVFLLANDSAITDSEDDYNGLEDFTTLRVVSATKPEDGIVTLGKLPKDAFIERMAEYGRGPHRLIQFRRAYNKFGIMYVNTHKKNSLKVLDDNGHVKTDIVRGF